MKFGWWQDYRNLQSQVCPLTWPWHTLEAELVRCHHPQGCAREGTQRQHQVSSGSSVGTEDWSVDGWVQ